MEIENIDSSVEKNNETTTFNDNEYLIDHFDNPERGFLKTDYHLNEIGHDEVFKKF